MSAPPVTAFAETAALYHLLNEDLAEARRIIGDMLPGERRVYAEQLERLRAMVGQSCEECGALTPAAEIVTVRPLGPNRLHLCRACAGMPSRGGEAG
ncbi:hypothetical protein [Nonomuraea wenchangensis]|uniref:Uncharacterized protein n=1 Tax=Nonomuraea wenchangensis TaxID=568860 RepID=A0A1I0LV50_9ACTN|nr:hypothetical protein [Nonomuraea wenchangensis]SEU46526.1 hypothetical protein SAMN05421811_12766 [Nonomuraea wenchangensis]